MASKKRGLSADEKKRRLLELFYESKEFFLMKELEKIAPKQKGIIPQSVKEITDILVDEGLVECEKIGTLSCYWAFPSKAAQTRKRKLDELTAKVNEATLRIEGLKADVEKARLGKEDTQERAKLLTRLMCLSDTVKELERKRLILAENGPEAVAKAEKCVNVAKVAVNRWTDNIFTIKKWCKTKFAMDDKLLNTEYGIDPEMDYVD
uniref:Meiotic nuclear division protein 1 homolog n=1 Tax=Syphacia muris TaxID=451379 RepID=A0A0N5AH39_9BILA